MNSFSWVSHVGPLKLHFMRIHWKESPIPTENRNRTDPSSSQKSARRQARMTHTTPAQLAVHNNFTTSINTMKRSLLRSIYYLGVIKEQGIYKTLGYSTITEYAAKEAGLGLRHCKSFLAMSRKLNDLPETSNRIESGHLTWRQAEEICRIATSETESTWIETAATHSVRELEAAVRNAKITAGVPPTPSGPTSVTPHPSIPVLDTKPPAKPMPSSIPHYMTLKLTSEQLMIWESWLSHVRRRDTTATKETFLCDALIQHGDAGEHVLRTVIHSCPKCGVAALPTSRGDCEAPRALLERAQCDGEIQHIDGRLTRIIAPRMRRRVLARDGHRCCAKDCLHTSHLEIHHIKPVASGGTTITENLVTLCSRCHRALHEGERNLEEMIRKAP